MQPIPASLCGRPFTTAQAEAAGVSRRMLDGSRFESLHPGRGVWAVAGEARDLRFLLRADRPALPADPPVSHLTGPQLPGVDLVPP